MNSNIENVDPSKSISIPPCHVTVSELKREVQKILSPKRFTSENINKTVNVNKTAVDKLKPQKQNVGKSRPPRSNNNRKKKVNHIPSRPMSLRYGTMSNHGRRRSSSTSSLQRLAAIRSNEDDISVGSNGSSSSFRSLRISTNARSISASRTRSDRIPSKVVKRTKSSRRTHHSAPSTPTGSKIIQKKNNGGENNSFLRQRVNSNGSLKWAEQQRKTKEERNKRRLQQSTGNGDNILVQELNKSYNPMTSSLEGPIEINGRPNKVSKKGSSVDEKKSSEESMTVSRERDEPCSSIKKNIFTPVSKIKKIATGLYSPKISPKVTPKPAKESQSPMSYSKAVRMGSTPPIIRKLFDDKTRDMLREISGVDVNTSETQNLSEQLFSAGTGVSDDEIRSMLNAKSSKINKWELKKQLEGANHTVKVLKATMHLLLKNKNKYISSSIELEKVLKGAWGRAARLAKEFDGERQQLKKSIRQTDIEIKTLKENNKDIARELNSNQEKVITLEGEMESVNTKLDESLRGHTEASIALEVEKARNQENEKQFEALREKLSALEAGKIEANKQAETTFVNSLERGKDIDRLRSRVINLESQLNAREEELSRALADSENAKECVASKDNTLSDLMKGLSDIQRSSQARENEANNLRKEAEKKTSDLERELLDGKSEITFLTHEKSVLEESLETVKIELNGSKSMLNSLKVDVDTLKQEVSAYTSQLKLEKELRLQSCQKEQEERNERIALSAQMFAMTKEHAAIERKLTKDHASIIRKWEEKVEMQQSLYNQKEKELSDHQEEIARREAEITSLKQALNDEKTMAQAKSAEEISRLEGEINMQKERMKIAEQKSLSTGAAKAEQVKNLELEISEYHAERRRMHNLIQELRGNIRVFARVRPFLPGDGVSNDALPCVVPNGENTMKLLMGGDLSQVHTFSFDRVFPPSAGQDAVFTEISELVQSALDGYNVCLFSYGQTGSGKTHTMQGSGNGQMRGIIPRSIEQVGQYKEKLERDRGWKYEMFVSFIEIYNERIYDLLREKEKEDKKHEIKVNNYGRRFISDVKMIPLEPSNANSVEVIMKLAAKRRSVGATDMNTTSSRSHSVFTLHLTALHPENGQELRGSLNLVDLAGSERLQRSKATGDRAKETMAINKSLSCLSDVFLAINKKSNHIPFRNSKLTYLLQPSLSGDGKSLMLVNLSPTESSTHESLCSLRFASQVNKCELGRAISSIKDATVGLKSVNNITKVTKPRGTPKTLRASTKKRTTKNDSVTRNVRTRLGNSEKS